MNVFYYFLVNSPEHPFKILAKDKTEVQSLLMESLASPDEIMMILTENEFYSKMNIQIPQSKQKEIPLNQPQNDTQAQTQQENIQKPQNNVYDAVVEKVSEEDETNTKYFEEGGIKFKVKNGKVFKQIWKDISEEFGEEFRVIGINNKKPINYAKYRLEKHVWHEIN